MTKATVIYMDGQLTLSFLDIAKESLLAISFTDILDILLLSFVEVQ